MSWLAWATLGAQLGIGSWLLFAAGSKLGNIDRSRRAVAAYSMMPPRLVPITPFLLVGAEALLGAALFLGVIPTVVFAAVTAMLSVFAVAMIVDLISGQRHACGCGADETPIGWPLVTRNLAAAALTAGLAVASPPGVPVESRAAAIAILSAIVVASGLTRTYRRIDLMRSG